MARLREESSYGVNIHRMFLQSEPTKKAMTICYASVQFSGDSRGSKNSLVRRLLRAVAPGLILDRNDPLISTDMYGCPRLSVEYQEPLALSFSYNGQELWAAVAASHALGIDVETSENFSAPYPYARAFMEEDLQLALPLCSKKEDAAALLWSCKEAAMKSQGTGFHCTDPRDVRILSCLQDGCGMYRVNVATPERISVVVTRERRLWFAVTARG